MLRRRHEELVKYHGKTDFMLPTELKMKGREKLYNVRSSLHQPDPTLVDATKDSYKEGSDFILGVEKFIYKQYEDMARERQKEEVIDLTKTFDEYPTNYK